MTFLMLRHPKKVVDFLFCENEGPKVEKLFFLLVKITWSGKKTGKYFYWLLLHIFSNSYIKLWWWKSNNIRVNCNLTRDKLQVWKKRESRRRKILMVFHSQFSITNSLSAKKRVFVISIFKGDRKILMEGEDVLNITWWKWNCSI